MFEEWERGLYMTFWEYCRDRIMLLLLQGACMCGSFFYLYFCGVKGNQLQLLYIAWAAVLLCYLICSWGNRRRYFNKIEDNLQHLDKPYLLSEVMPLSHRLEDRLYRRLLRVSNKSVIDAVHRLETSQQEYRDFIENWIHEVKLPITTMQLMCENRKSRRQPEKSSTGGAEPEEIRKFEAQLAQLENDVEKALYFARSDTVSQDYMIREIHLKDVVLEAVRRNAPYLIRSRVGVDLELGEEKVYCDDKWLVFIVSQILVNSVKYRRENCRIRICGIKEAAAMKLVIEDNGTGIPKNELDRIFDKGFTGTNGRTTRQSTGIGLYLCRKLCSKLGLSLHAESEEGKYTRMILSFPDGSSYFSR